MIENQEQANARANEIAGKYGLVDAFRHQSAGGIALALWEEAQDKLGDEDYANLSEIVDLAFYLDKNYYYAYLMGMCAFYLDNDESAVGWFETSLTLLGQSGNLNSSLTATISQSLVLQRLYMMLLESYIRTERYEDALELYNTTTAVYDDITNPDFFIMIAQLLIVSGRNEDAIRVLDRASELNNEIIEPEPPELKTLRDATTEEIQNVLTLLQQSEQITPPVRPPIQTVRN